MPDLSPPPRVPTGPPNPLQPPPPGVPAISRVKTLWSAVKSNAYFVAFEGAMLGTLMDGAYDELQSGHLDFSSAGWHKLLAMSLLSGIAAVRALYRPQPNAITIPVAQPASIEPPLTPAKEQ